MPTLETKNGYYRTRVFHEGKQHFIGLKTKVKKDAEGTLKLIEAGLWKLKTEQTTLPVGVSLSEWLLSGGRITRASEHHTLGELTEAYKRDLPEGAKSAATIQGENIHHGHLLKVLGERLPLNDLNTETLQRYISKRSRMSFRGKRISGPTIKKELRTLSVLITYGKSRCWIDKDAKPTRGLCFPRSEEKPIFRTYAETTDLVDGLDDDEQTPYWESVYLDSGELREFLDHCRDNSPTPWFYPVVACCVYTGCRRSEWIRARKVDFDLTRKQFSIRERKRKHNVSESTRIVSIHPRLEEIIRDWFESYPGGRIAFCEARDTPLTIHQAYHFWQTLIKGTKWSKLRGYHVLRHSFISSLATAGVDQRTIDEFAGHSTEEQRRRYRHLHRDTAIDAISRLTF